MEEIAEHLADTSNMSVGGEDHVNWEWAKHIFHMIEEIKDRQGNVINTINWGAKVYTFFKAYYNACIKMHKFPDVFKRSITVVIPKPNKPDYSKAKAYRPICLLSVFGKLFEKILARRMQFDGQKYGVLHPCQFGGTIQHSTVDVGMQVVHFVHEAWARNLVPSMLLLDISQFYPSINHKMMVEIFRKQGFADDLCDFFADYFVGRFTKYLFNGKVTEVTAVPLGVGQGSSLSTVASGCYIAPVLHKQYPIGKPIEGNASLQFFVDDGGILVAVPLNLSPLTQVELNCQTLAVIFHALMANLVRLGLSAEADKLECIHFWNHQKPWWTDRPFGPDIEVYLGNWTVRIIPSPSMRYLGFYLDPKLSFKSHMRFYACKAASTVSAISMLGNSLRGFNPAQKRQLYIAHVLPLICYGAQLWWKPGWKGIKWILREFHTAQARACRWISGCFRTSPIGAMESLVGLVPLKANMIRR